MTEFVKKAREAVGADAVRGMVERDLKYKRDARKRQIACIVLLCTLITIFILFTFIQLQTLDAMTKIINKVSHVISQ